MLKLLTVELFLIFIFILARYLYNSYKFNKTHKFKIKLYDIFALRDELIYLVANKQIEEKDKTFQLIYNRFNTSLHFFEKVNQLHLKTIEKIFKELNEEEVHNLEDRIKIIESHPSAELKNIVRRYDDRLIKIVLTNSVFYIIIKYVIPNIPKTIPSAIKNTKLAIKVKELRNNYEYFGEESAAIA